MHFYQLNYNWLIINIIRNILLQPIVENALNHGIFHMEGTGELNINFLKGNAEGQLLCIVDNNGIGRTKAKQ